MASSLNKLQKKANSEKLVKTKKTEKNETAGMADLYINNSLPQIIRIDHIEPNPNNTRTVDIESESFKELISSIKDMGLQQNLVVYKKAEDRFVLLTGHRRLAAMKMILEENPKENRFSSVPCLVVELKGDPEAGISKELEEKMLLVTTNKEFEQLGRRAILENLKIAIEYSRLRHPEKKSKGIISKEVSNSVGWSKRKIDYFIHFDEKLISELKKAFFDDEVLTFRMAEYLCKLSVKSQKKIYEAFKYSLEDMTIAVCNDVLNNIKQIPQENPQKITELPKERKEKKEEPANFHSYPECPEEFSKNKITEINGKRKFNQPDDLSEEDLEVEPIKDIKLVMPQELINKKTRLGKTAYRKYVTAINQINKQFCVISDILEENE